jgi:hypothetical protein
MSALVVAHRFSSPLEQIRIAFQMFDADGSGEIDR